jgi:hypothetical protein
VTLCDSVTVLAETKNVTKSRLHCTFFTLVALSESEGANVDLVLFTVNDDIAVDILNSLKFFEAILISFFLHNWSLIVYCCVLVSSQDQQTHLRKQGKLGYLCSAPSYSSIFISEITSFKSTTVNRKAWLAEVGPQLTSRKSQSVVTSWDVRAKSNLVRCGTYVHA